MNRRPTKPPRVRCEGRLPNDHIVRLTKAQIHVLDCLGHGLSNADIARQMRYADKTVKNYLYDIFQEFGCTNRVEAVVMAASAGFLPMYAEPWVWPALAPPTIHRSSWPTRFQVDIIAAVLLITLMILRRYWLS